MARIPLSGLAYRAGTSAHRAAAGLNPGRDRVAGHGPGRAGVADQARPALWPPASRAGCRAVPGIPLLMSGPGTGAAAR